MQESASLPQALVDHASAKPNADKGVFAKAGSMLLPPDSAITSSGRPEASPASLNRNTDSTALAVAKKGAAAVADTSSAAQEVPVGRHDDSCKSIACTSQVSGQSFTTQSTGKASVSQVLLMQLHLMVVSLLSAADVDVSTLPVHTAKLITTKTCDTVMHQAFRECKPQWGVQL